MNIRMIKAMAHLTKANTNKGGGKYRYATFATVSSSLYSCSQNPAFSNPETGFVLINQSVSFSHFRKAIVRNSSVQCLIPLKLLHHGGYLFSLQTHHISGTYYRDRLHLENQNSDKPPQVYYYRSRGRPMLCSCHPPFADPSDVPRQYRRSR